MSDDRFDPQNPSLDSAGQDAFVQQFMTRTYGWMTAGLALTAIIALFVASSPDLVREVFGNRILFYGIIIAEFLLVIGLSAAINRLSPIVATLGFLFYAALNGVTLSMILLVYTAASVASTFFITTLTFGGMALYGTITKRDLTAMGSFMVMGLWGLVIASLVNLFFQSSMIQWVLGYVGVIVFTGLTAWDAQKIKALAIATQDDEQSASKASIMGALTLYLDFINLFLSLLRILGRRNNN